MHIEAIKEVLAQAMNKYFQFSNNVNIFSLVIKIAFVKPGAHLVS